MKFNDVTFPHPVLGIGDAIESNVELLQPEIISLQDVYEVKLNYKHNNADLKKLIAENKAEYFCEVTCSNTLFRKLFLSDFNTIEFQIPKKEVKGKVEFTCLLVAKEAFENYTNSEAHQDYDNYTFDIDRGDVLAYFKEFSFDADIMYEKLKAVSSFMEIVENEDSTYTNIDLKKNKIEIQLPSEDFNVYRSDMIAQEEKFAPVFHSSIVLNALLIALYNFEEHKEYLWAKVIDYRLKNERLFKDINFDEKENIPEIAQRILGNPINRLLNGLNVIVEFSNEE